MRECAKKCDIIITMDCDGQDDINLIDKMVDCYTKNKSKIVFAIRKKRKMDSIFKRFLAISFYSFLHLIDPMTLTNHAEYRLICTELLNNNDISNSYPLYLRGYFSHIDVKSECLYYERQKRLAGKSKYVLIDMIKLASDGIRFSIRERFLR